MTVTTSFSLLGSALEQLKLRGPICEYRLRRVIWCQELGFWSHQYIVLKFETLTSQTLYIRLERDKTGWLKIGRNNLLRTFKASTTHERLTANSFRIADYKVKSNHVLRKLFTLDDLVFFAEDLFNRQYPRYSLLAFNCWWFATSLFDSIARYVGPEHFDFNRYASTRNGTERVTYEKAIVFCDTYHFLSHWPYGSS